MMHFLTGKGDQRSSPSSRCAAARRVAGPRVRQLTGRYLPRHRKLLVFASATCCEAIDSAALWSGSLVPSVAAVGPNTAAPRFASTTLRGDPGRGLALLRCAARGYVVCIGVVSSTAFTTDVDCQTAGQDHLRQRPATRSS